MRHIIRRSDVFPIDVSGKCTGSTKHKFFLGRVEHPIKKIIPNSMAKVFDLVFLSAYRKESVRRKIFEFLPGLWKKV